MPDIHVNTLEHLLQQHGYIPEPQVLWMFIYVLKDLELSHSQAQLHLDIKPSRIVRSTGGSHKLTGYGASRLGTPKYTAPERAQRKPPDARSDIYSLGAVLYEAATGKPPFDATLNYELLDAHVNRRPAPPQSVRPEVSAELQRIILTSLAKDPAARFQNAREFREALERLAGSRTSETKPPVSEPEQRKPVPVQPAPQPSSTARPAPVPPQAGTVPAARPRPRPQGKGERIPTGAMTTPGVMSGKRPSSPGQPAPAQPAPGPVARPSPPVAEVKKAEPMAGARPAKPPAPKPAVKRPAFRGPVLAIPPAVVAVLIVVLLASARARAQKVPRLVGLSEQAARAAVARRGLVLLAADSLDDTLPQGTVVRQAPETGVKAAKADTVRVSLSTGLVKVPNLAGLTYDEAAGLLARSGLAPGAADSTYSDSQPAGRVVRTSPRAATRTSPRSEVRVTVGQGRVTCPECGTRREGGAKFCTTCGYRFEI